MDAFSTITLLVHIAAVLVLLSTLPRQMTDIWRETDPRYRKICWIVFFGTLALMCTNALQLMLPLFYNTDSERFFNNLTSTMHAAVGIILGILAHMLYKNSDKTVPRTIDDVEKHRL